MPGNILSADTGFPDLEGARSTEEKLRLISGYLYTLLEQLRYTLSNLGQDNFNEAELDGLSKTLTGPLLLKVKDVEDSLAEVVIKADGISTTVTQFQDDVAKNYSTKEQTATEISSAVSEAEGRVGTKISQTANEITQQVKAVDGRVTSVSTTVDGLNVSTESGNQSCLNDVALRFKDSRNTLIGRVEMVNDQDIADKNNPKRMYVGTEQTYSLKLHSSGDSSWDSSLGDIYIQTGGAHVIILTPGGASSYSFRPDGIYYGGYYENGFLKGGRKIVDNTKAV